jgi:hypothetical protein
MSEVAIFYFLQPAFSLNARAKTFICGVLNRVFIFCASVKRQSRQNAPTRQDDEIVRPQLAFRVQQGGRFIDHQRSIPRAVDPAEANSDGEGDGDGGQRIAFDARLEVAARGAHLALRVSRTVADLAPGVSNRVGEMNSGGLLAMLRQLAEPFRQLRDISAKGRHIGAKVGGRAFNIIGHFCLLFNRPATRPKASAPG